MTNIATALAGVPLVAQAHIDTPIGPMTALATQRGLAGLWFDAQAHHPGDLDAPTDAANPHIATAREWLRGYWSGEEPPLTSLTLDLHGSAFQRTVWKVLCGIGYGCTRSYGEVAALVGGGAVPRATGSAVGRNPVGVIVPCHRVIGANGSLTGYAGGLHRKERLLQHEGILLA
jgi:methylated-DNA-[protein]-cysteine S-methyltransferase